MVVMKAIILMKDIVEADGWLLKDDILWVAIGGHWDINGRYQGHKELRLPLQGQSNGENVYGDGKKIAAKLIPDEPYVPSGYVPAKFLSLGKPVEPTKKVEIYFPPDDSEGKRPLGYDDFYEILECYLKSHKPYSFVYDYPESEREKLSEIIMAYNRYDHLAYELTTNFQYSPNFSWPNAFIAPLYGVLHHCHKHNGSNSIRMKGTDVLFNGVVIGYVSETLKQLKFISPPHITPVTCLDKRRVLEVAGLVALHEYLQQYHIPSQLSNAFVLTVGNVKIYNIPIVKINDERELYDARSDYEFVLNHLEKGHIVNLSDVSDVVAQLQEWAL